MTLFDDEEENKRKLKGKASGPASTRGDGSVNRTIPSVKPKQDMRYRQKALNARMAAAKNPASPRTGYTTKNNNSDSNKEAVAKRMEAMRSSRQSSSSTENQNETDIVNKRKKVGY